MIHQPTRRDVLKYTALAAACAATTAYAQSPATTAATLDAPTVSHLPRWRGFNLLEKFIAQNSAPYREEDFSIIADWGFNFVRLPMSYWCWSTAESPFIINEDGLKDIDQAVEFGRQYNVHVNLNLHRAPGYCVNPPTETLELWTDPQALDACAHHWAHFARRYKGIPSARLTFDLLNEPPDIPEPQYAHVVRHLVDAIHAEDPDRLVIADGLKWGTAPVPSLAGVVAQSTRGYTPSRVTHYRASWVKGSDQWPAPTWPLAIATTQPDGVSHEDRWDKSRLQRDSIAPWQHVQSQGVGVHVGEWGCHNQTPHDVALAWMADNLSLWRDANFGWALWNLRGSFGVLNSNRNDVAYESFRTHKLDRAMLDLLRAG